MENEQLDILPHQQLPTPVDPKKATPTDNIRVNTNLLHMLVDTIFPTPVSVTGTGPTTQKLSVLTGTTMVTSPSIETDLKKTTHSANISAVELQSLSTIKKVASGISKKETPTPLVIPNRPTMQTKSPSLDILADTVFAHTLHEGGESEDTNKKPSSVSSSATVTATESPILPPLEENTKDDVFHGVLQRVENTYKSALAKSAILNEQEEPHVSQITRKEFPSVLTPTLKTDIAWGMGKKALSTETVVSPGEDMVFEQEAKVDYYAAPTYEGGEVGVFINEGNSEYNLKLRQQPRLVRCSMISERGGDRKPVEPVPIIQITFDGQSKNQNPRKNQFPYPFFFLHASLIHPVTGEDENTIDDTGKRAMVGTVASSVYRLKDIDDMVSGFFIFPELAIRKVGKFRFKFILFELINTSDGPSSTVRRGHLVSDVFEVSDNYDYVGSAEITELTKHFAEQGIRLRVPKSAWISAKKAKKSIHEKDSPEVSNESPSTSAPTPHVQVSTGYPAYEFRQGVYYYPNPVKVQRRGSDSVVYASPYGYSQGYIARPMSFPSAPVSSSPHQQRMAYDTNQRYLTHFNVGSQQVQRVPPQSQYYPQATYVRSMVPQQSYAILRTDPRSEYVMRRHSQSISDKRSMDATTPYSRSPVHRVDGTGHTTRTLPSPSDALRAQKYPSSSSYSFSSSKRNLPEPIMVNIGRTGPSLTSSRLVQSAAPPQSQYATGTSVRYVQAYHHPMTPTQTYPAGMSGAPQQVYHPSIHHAIRPSPQHSYQQPPPTQDSNEYSPHPQMQYRSEHPAMFR